MSSDIETTIPVIPISNSLLLPGNQGSLQLGRAKSMACALETFHTPGSKVAIFVQHSDTDNPGLEDFLPVGIRGVVHAVKSAGKGLEVVVEAIERVRLLEMVSTEPHLVAKITILAPPSDGGPTVEGLERAVTALGLKMSSSGRIAPLDSNIVRSTPLPLKAYIIASSLRLPAAKEQQLLLVETNEELLRLLLDCLNYECEVLELRDKIVAEAKGQLEQSQKESLIRQQITALRKELGEDKDADAEVLHLRERLQKGKLPPRPEEEALRQLKLLERIPPAAAEYQVSQTYLELILDLPWSASSEEVVDLAQAREILDQDHFGLRDVKERILEYLAVMKLNPSAHAPILCFVGPPGTGKTSLGKSIARSVGRKFERMSLGGLHDESELRGHRRTYVGAMSGRIIQAVRRAGVNNPLLMLDEIDKLGRGMEGDPASALLELLDPAQNNEFHDNYLDLPFDLSKVFFIATANTIDTIPNALLDRLELIHLSGYTQEEKLQIAQSYLLPRQILENGLPQGKFSVPAETVESLIRHYTREAGVRQLDRVLARLCRRVALGLAEGVPTPEVFSSAVAEELLGPEGFMVDMARAHLGPGVVAGLAWTEAGGEVLYVEVGMLEEGKELILTGNLGIVMKESAHIARSFVTTRSAALGLDESLPPHSMHIHVPSGATPKDGPSAGLAMVCALVSAITSLPACPDTAMTGEISLSGLVLPVGGVKEKLLAARRAGLKRILLPRLNAKDLSELPESVREELDILLVDSIEEALPLVIPGLTKSLAALVPPVVPGVLL